MCSKNDHKRFLHELAKNRCNDLKKSTSPQSPNTTSIVLGLSGIENKRGGSESDLGLRRQRLHHDRIVLFISRIRLSVHRLRDGRNGLHAFVVERLDLAHRQALFQQRDRICDAIDVTRGCSSTDVGRNFGVQSRGRRVVLQITTSLDVVVTADAGVFVTAVGVVDDFNATTSSPVPRLTAFLQLQLCVTCSNATADFSRDDSII